MNAFLKRDAYYKHMSREASTTLVFIDGELVGYYTLLRGKIKVEDGSETECLEISRIAVIGAKQRQGIGTTILTHILELADTFNERYIILFAVTEKVDWYRNHGFRLASEEEYQKDIDTAVIYMYLNLEYPDLLEEYFENP